MRQDIGLKFSATVGNQPVMRQRCERRATCLAGLVNERLILVPRELGTFSTIHPWNGLHLATGDAGLLGAPGDVAPLIGRAFEDATIVGGNAQTAHAVERHAGARVLQRRVEFDARDAVAFLAALLGLALEVAFLLEASGADYQTVGCRHAATGVLIAGDADA